VATANIIELNRRIIINSYLYGQDQAGGNTRTLLSTYPVWAKVTNTSGSRLLDQMEITYSRAFEIIKRYEVSRSLNLNDEIIYENAVLSIAAIEKMEEGKRWWQRITAYATGQEVSGEVDVLCSWYQTEW
jgi:head-tail adaptor